MGVSSTDESAIRLIGSPWGSVSEVYRNMERKELRCPRCKSTDYWKAGWKILSGKKVQMLQCKKCGFKFRGKEVITLQF